MMMTWLLILVTVWLWLIFDKLDLIHKELKLQRPRR